MPPSKGRADAALEALGAMEAANLTVMDGIAGMLGHALAAPG